MADTFVIMKSSSCRGAEWLNLWKAINHFCIAEFSFSLFLDPSGRAIKSCVQEPIPDFLCSLLLTLNAQGVYVIEVI